MKKGLMVLCIMLGLSMVISARDIKTESGEVFKDVSISSVTPTGIDISFQKKGVYFIKHLMFTDLSKEIQKEFGYKPKKAEAYLEGLRKHAEMVEKKYKEELKKREEISAEQQQIRSRIEAGAVNVLLKMTQSKPDGVIAWANSVKPMNGSTGHMGKVFVYGLIGMSGGAEARVIYPTGLTKYGFPVYAATLEQAVILKTNSNN